MKKTGRVLNFEKRKVHIVTEDNEFIVVKRGSKKPVKNEQYTGDVIKLTKAQKKILSFCFVLILTFSIAIISMYLTTKATLIVDMNVTYKVKINKYDKIISVQPLNSNKAKEIIKTTNVKGDTLNSGLCDLFRACISNDIIDIDYIDTYGTVTVYVLNDTSIFRNNNNNNNNIKLDLYAFESELNTKGLKLIINNRGKIPTF
ncbi:MAG: hypothetical protein RSB70_04290 [Clostridium sp.]